MSSDPYGIDHRYLDANGEERDSDPDAIRVLQARIGRPPADRPPVPLVLRPGAEVPAGTLELEDGGSCEVGGVLPPDVPLGYHRLVDRAGGGRPLILGPGRAHLPARLRNWGWAVQLYAMRSARSWGTGDLADLRRLAHWSAQDLGAGFLLVNPLAAPAPTFPQQPSPYYPASRRFRSPLYLAVEEVPGAAEVDRAPGSGVGRR